MSKRQFAAEDVSALMEAALEAETAGDRHHAFVHADRVRALAGIDARPYRLRERVFQAEGWFHQPWGRAARELEALQGRPQDRLFHHYRVAVAGRIVGLFPDDATAWTVLASVLRAAGRAEDARLAGQRAVELDPDQTWAHHGLGNLARDAGDRAAALDHYRAAARADGSNWRSWLSVGHMAIELEQFADAEAALKRARKLAPEHPYPASGMGNLRAREGRGDQAQRWYRKALASTWPKPPERAWALQGLGHVLLSAGRAEEAVPCFQEAGEVDPTSTLGPVGLGQALRNLGRHQEALPAWTEALARVGSTPTRENPPARLEIVEGLAGTWIDLGTPQKAVELLESEGVRENPGLRALLGHALVEAGQIDRGATLLAAARGGAGWAPHLEAVLRRAEERLRGGDEGPAAPAPASEAKARSDDGPDESQRRVRGKKLRDMVRRLGRRVRRR